MRTLLFSFLAFITFVPVAVFAQNNNLVNLPIGETDSFNDYINAVYVMFISIAALIAVIKIIIAGVKYMFTDIVTQKGEAKRDIQGALLGLLVVLGAVVVLSIINPDLTTFNPSITGIEERVAPPPATSGSNSGIESCINNARCTAISCESSNCRDEITQCQSEEGRNSFTTGDGSMLCIGSPTLYENLCGPDGSGCVNTSCRFTRLGTCSDACQNDGGYFHESGNIAYGAISGQFDSCSIPTQDRSISYIPCARVSNENGESYDCTIPAEGENLSAIDTCTESGTNGSFAYETTNVNFIEDNTPQITCIAPTSAPPIEVFPCQQTGPGQFDCTSAEARCTGNRIATQTNLNEITCQ